MKKAILVIACLVAFAGVSFAQHIGPATPSKNFQGRVASGNFGIGYDYVQSTWDIDGGSFDTDFEQNQAYLHLGAVFGDISTPNYEVFLRLGAADLEADDFLVEGETFDGGTEMMYAAGIKGEFFQGPVFGIGGVLQASYINSFSDDTIININGTNLRLTGEIENMWDVELAFPIQAKLNSVIIYGGPIAYISTADVRADISDGFTSISAEDDIDENHNVGAFGGCSFRLNNISIDLEAKYKSDFSVGAFASITF